MISFRVYCSLMHHTNNNEKHDMNNATLTTIITASTEELLNIVIEDERNNGCSDRVKLNRINAELMKREGKTAFVLLTERETATTKEA